MNRTIKLIAHSALFAFSISVASAHSEVDSNTPGNGAVLEAVPSHIIMTFADSLRLTRVQLTHDNETSLDLDLDNQKKFSKRFEVPISDLGKGIYRIEWRGLADDGHPMRGGLEFEVK